MPSPLPLTWSHYVRLLAARNELARKVYESEAIRGGWSIRQLDRQIDSFYYERTALSKNKAAMLAKGRKPSPGDANPQPGDCFAGRTVVPAACLEVSWKCIPAFRFICG